MWLDDDTYLHNSSSHSIGEIKLVINRSSEPNIKIAKMQTSTYSAPPLLQKVHERSKKAIAHRVK